MPRNDPFDTTGFDAGSDVGVSATVGPLSTLPVIRTVDGKGTAKLVADLATRDAIPGELLGRDDPLQYRVEGMTCFVQATQRTYRLQGGIANANWVDVTSPANVGAKTRNVDEAVLVGQVIAQSDVTAQRIKLADPSADNGLSRPLGVATSAQATIGQAAQVQTSQGEPVNVLLVAGLTPALGAEIILSTTPGSGTFPGQAGAPPSGQVVQRYAVLTDPLTYDGAADLTVLAQLDNGGTRRLEA